MSIVLEPVGIVRSPRQAIGDEEWGSVISVIELHANCFTPEAIAGLEDFSHLEVIYHFHEVPEARIETGARHPRNREDWPLVGIFAQRGKNRPNRLGLARCNLLKIDGLRLTVQRLDAIEGTPVLDIKPYMAEFGPIGELRQPDWAAELMSRYYA